MANHTIVQEASVQSKLYRINGSEAVPFQVTLKWTAPVDVNLALVYQINHEIKIPDTWRAVFQVSDIGLFLLTFFFGCIPGAITYYLFHDWFLLVICGLIPTIVVFLINLYARSCILPGAEGRVDRLRRGNNKNFPFAVFLYDAGIGGKKGPKEEKIVVSDFTPYENMLLVGSIHNGPNQKTFQDFDAAVELKWPGGCVDLQLKPTEKGAFCTIVSINRDDDGFLIRPVLEAHEKPMTMAGFLLRETMYPEPMPSTDKK